MQALINCERVLKDVAALVRMVISVHDDSIKEMLLDRDRRKLRMSVTLVVVAVQFDPEIM